jgi:laminin alpha 1/2
MCPLFFRFVPRQTCLHNTEGENCDRCKESFYGNADDGNGVCNPCKCPMDVPTNNFSPKCEVATVDFDKYSIAPDEYVCTACPRGYAGAHCERKVF